jgi:hypothetical protein
VWVGGGLFVFSLALGAAFALGRAQRVREGAAEAPSSLSQPSAASTPPGARPAANSRDPSTILDPAACPKGKVLIDTASGKAIHCAGTGDTKTESWLQTLGTIAKDPGAIPSKKTSRIEPSTAGGVAWDGNTIYEYDLPPLKDVTLTVYDGDKTQFGLHFDAPPTFTPRQLASSVRELCDLGDVQVYALGDGVFASSQVKVERGENGRRSVEILSATELKREVAVHVRVGGKPPSSLDKLLCPA